MAATVTRQQFIAAVAQVDDLNTVYAALSADANNPDWREFYAAVYVSQGDPLYTQTQIALGYTTEQMQSLFDLTMQEPA